MDVKYWVRKFLKLILPQPPIYDGKLHLRVPGEAYWQKLVAEHTPRQLPSDEGFWVGIADEFEAWKEVFGGGFNVRPTDPSMYDRATTALPSLAYVKNDDGSFTMNLEGGAEDIKW